MTIQKNTLFQVAGIVMIVGSFFSATKAIGGILSFIAMAATISSPGDSPMGDAIETIYINHLGNSLAESASFLVLFFAGRWMLKGPKMIDRWISRSEDKVS